MSIYSVSPVQICRIPGGYVDLTRGQSVMGEPPDEAENHGIPEGNCISVPQTQICKIPGGYVDITYGYDQGRSVAGTPPENVKWNPFCFQNSLNGFGMTELVDLFDEIGFEIFRGKMGRDADGAGSAEYLIFADSVYDADHHVLFPGQVFAEGYPIPSLPLYGQDFSVVNIRGEYIGRVSLSIGAHFYGYTSLGEMGNAHYEIADNMNRPGVRYIENFDILDLPPCHYRHYQHIN